MTKLFVRDDEKSPQPVFESSFTDEGDEVVVARMYGRAWGVPPFVRPPLLLKAGTPILLRMGVEIKNLTDETVA